jgi:hypothetical protein
MDELQASSTKLGQQLADMCTAKQQAEDHAGVTGAAGLLLYNTANSLCVEACSNGSQSVPG